MDYRIPGHDGAYVFLPCKLLLAPSDAPLAFKPGSRARWTFSSGCTEVLSPCHPATRATAQMRSIAKAKHGARDFARFFVISLHDLDGFALRFSAAFFRRHLFFEQKSA